MASTDDLSEQLSIMTKLNNVIERMSTSVQSIEGSYESQIAVLERLATAVGNIDASRTVTELGKINETLQDIVKGLKNVGSMSDDSLNKIISQSGKANAAAVALSGGLGAAAASMSKMSSKGQGGMSGLSKGVEEAATELHRFDEVIKKISGQSTGKLVKSLGIIGGAIKGFQQGIRNVVALSKGTLGFITSLASGVLNVSAAIAAIPLKIFTGLVDMAASAEGGSNELLQALENLRKEMGNLNKSGAHAVLETTKTLKGFSDTGLSTWRVFGTLAERLEAVTKVAVAMEASFGTLKKEFVDNGGALLAFQKGLGVTDEQMKGFGQRAITSGQPLSKVFLDVTKQTLALGDAFDVDQKLIGKDLARAVVDVKHFGSVTVKEIGQASVYARKLGVELDKIVGTLDAFETFDTAAENAAKLSQSFGVTVDAFKLMEAQSPAEQLDMLRKSFKDAGVDSSNFSRQQLKLLQSTTGLDEATAKQVFSLKNAGVSLDDIKKKSEGAEKKQLSQAEAMSKLADSIERLVKSGMTQSGGFFDQFVKGFLRGIQSTKEFRQMIMFIKRDLQTAMYAGVQLGRTFEKVFPGVKDFFGGIRDFFEPKRFAAFFREINKSFTQFFTDVTTGKYSFAELMNKLRATFFDFFSTSTPSGQRTLNGFTSFTKSLTKIVGQAIPWVAEQLGKGLQTISDIVSGKKKLTGLQGPAKGSLGFLVDLFTPILDGLKKAWDNKDFREGLQSFVTTMGDGLEKIFKSATFRSVSHKVIKTLLFTLFAPAALQAALGGVTTAIGGKVVKGLADAIFKKGGEGVARKAASSGLVKVLGLGAGAGALIGAAVGIGRGVERYTDTITSTLDHSSKVIAAAATGVIDSLTLGLLPKGFSEEIANTLAELTDTIFEGISNVFGPGFGQTVKRYVAGAFEVVGGLWSLIKNLFTGDQESFNRSAVDFGLSLVRFVVNAFEYVLVQMPLLLTKLTTQVMAALTGVIIKLVTGTVGIITTGIDKAFGTNITDKISKTSDDIQKAISDGANDMAKDLDSLSANISSATGKFNDTYLRSADDRAKVIRDASQKVSQEQATATQAAGAKVERSLSGALDDVKAAKDIQKELGGLDFKGLLGDVKSKLADVDFNILSEDQASQLSKAGELSKSLSSTVDNVTGFFGSLSKLPETIKGATAALKKDAIAPAIEAVNNLVKLANDLDSALADGALNKVDVKAKLANVANAVGLGGKASYTVSSKPINMTVNLTVTMNVDDVEKAIVMRASSIIRDRLNFATGENAGRRGSPPIPETRTPNLQNINPVD